MKRIHKFYSFYATETILICVLTKTKITLFWEYLNAPYINVDEKQMLKEACQRFIKRTHYNYYITLTI